MIKRANSQKTIFIFSNFKLVYKIILTSGLTIVGVIAVLNYFFLQDLAKSRINEIKEMANTTSIIVSELALSGLINRNQTRVIKALDESITVANKQEGGFLQISVIMYPSGFYYASSNNNLLNKKVHQSLLKRIEANNESETTVEKLNYEFDKKTIPVLHFLRNITIMKKGEESRVAVTQIIYNYESILNQTRLNLLLIGCILLLFVIVFSLLIHLPFSKVNKQLITGFNQIVQRNFEYSLKSKDNSDIGFLYRAFNRMAGSLQEYFVERQQSKMSSVFKSLDASSSAAEAALRKTEITCLCARIPGIQATIEDDTLDSVTESVNRFLEPFDKIIQEYGGQVIKILGDKVYVLFEGINGIDNSIRTSLKISQQWHTINHENKVLNRKQLSYGIGLHSAVGVAGTIGTASLSYTLVGKAVSIAEYLCACAGKEEILVSSSLMDKASGTYQHQIITELKPTDLSDEEEYLVITNRQTSDELLFGAQARETDITSISIQGFENGLGNKRRSTIKSSAMESEISGISGSSVDSSIPDMLEETLTSAPLDSISLEEPKASSKDKKPTEKKSSKESTRKKQSLWDEFDAGKP